MFYLGQLISGGIIFDIIFNEKLRIYTPLKLKDESFKNKQDILEKSKLSENEFDEISYLILKRLHFVSQEEYEKYIKKLQGLLRYHKKDEDFEALCLLKEWKLWTYEKRIFDIGLGISTKEISGELG